MREALFAFLHNRLNSNAVPMRQVVAIAHQTKFNSHASAAGLNLYERIKTS